MCNIHVTAQDELAPGLELRQVRMKLLQKTKFGLLPLFPGRAAGEITADDRALGTGGVKAQLDVTALSVKLGRAVADPHVAGFMPRIQAHTGITFLLGKVKMSAQAGQVFKAALHIKRLCPDLLHTNTIRRSLGEPGFQAFACRGADAVEVEAS